MAFFIFFSLIDECSPRAQDRRAPLAHAHTFIARKRQRPFNFHFPFKDIRSNYWQWPSPGLELWVEVCLAIAMGFGGHYSKWNFESVCQTSALVEMIRGGGGEARRFRRRLNKSTAFPAHANIPHRHFTVTVLHQVLF